MVIPEGLGRLAAAGRGALIVIVSVWLASCGTFAKTPMGVSDSGLLKPCPQAPRCVSSVAANAERRVAALQLREASQGAWESLLQTLDAMSRTVLVEQQPHYVRAEITSPWGVYTDDLELLRETDSTTIHIRSSSRIGYYDFNVNRERVEALRAAGVKAGILHEDGNG